MTFADLSPLANHLWQSTLCVAVAWLLTLGMRKNRAAVRYGVWMAASVKFLIPFSLLVSAGAQLEWRKVPIIAPPQLSAAIDDIAQPFAAQAPAPLPAVAAPALHPWPAILFAVWLGGIAIGIVFWLRCWWQVRSMRRAATPLELRLPVKVMSSPTHREPGVLGIRKPCLLLPEGIADRLTPPQLEAILAHELRHVERRDNLTAAIHMLVETIFWFHPCVWWIRARLMEERERACDEEVLRMGSEPQVYAESILKVCEFYLTSPAPCAGVTGGELKKRIEGIMANRSTRELNFGKRMLFAAAALLAIAGPIAIGLMNMPRGSAQSQTGGPKAPANMAVTEALFIEPPAGWRNPGAPSPSPVPQVSGALAPPVASAQTPAPTLSFEVASVKSSSGTGGQTTAERARGWGDVTGRVNLEDIHLTDVLLRAYGLQPYQLSGPAWLDTDLFEILAVVPADAPKRQIPLMFQALLEERFKLRFHREAQVAPAYALVVAAGGPKLKESVPDDIYVPPTETTTLPSGSVAHSSEGTGPFGMAKTRFANGILHTEFASMRMKLLTGYLNQYPDTQYVIGLLDLPVVDMTELKGSYQVTLDISRGDMPRARAPANQEDGGQALPTASDPPGNSVRASLQKLGLKLERRRLPVEKFVIDHIERAPTEN